MRFLSVGPRICLQLPSGSTSRWTPLLFSYTFPTTWACSGLSPARARPWRANETCAARRTSTKKSPDITPRLFFFHILVICTIILYSWHWSGSKSIYSPVYNNLSLASGVKNRILNGFFFYQNSCYIKRNQLISSRQCIYLCRKARI